MERQTYNIAEAARILGVSPRHLYTLAATGEVHVLKLGNRIVIPRARLEEMLAGPRAE